MRTIVYYSQMTVSANTYTAELSEGIFPSTSPPILDFLMLLKVLQSNIADLAEEHGVTIVQLYTMHNIAEDHCTMGKMAQAMRCDASNMTGIIDKLTTMGLVTRQDHPTDRRIKTVQLTSEGCKVLDDIMSAMPARLGYSRISNQDVADLRRILLKLTGGATMCDQQ